MLSECWSTGRKNSFIDIFSIGNRRLMLVPTEQRLTWRRKYCMRVLLKSGKQLHCTGCEKHMVDRKQSGLPTMSEKERWAPTSMTDSPQLPGNTDELTYCLPGERRDTSEKLQSYLTGFNSRILQNFSFLLFDSSHSVELLSSLG